MTWLLVEDDVDVLHVEIEHVVGISLEQLHKILYIIPKC
jgi:hypothetical protein